MADVNNEDLHPAVYRLFDRYVHSQISRREFVSQLGAYAVGGLTVAAILEYLSPRYATAQQVAAGDPRLDEEFIEYASGSSGEFHPQAPTGRVGAWRANP